MAILVNLDQLLLLRRINSSTFAAMINISKSNLSILKTDKARLIRFSTLDSICRTLDCQPGDLLKYVLDRETS